MQKVEEQTNHQREGRDKQIAVSVDPQLAPDNRRSATEDPDHCDSAKGQLAGNVTSLR